MVRLGGRRPAAFSRSQRKRPRGNHSPGAGPLLVSFYQAGTLAVLASAAASLLACSASMALRTPAP